MPRTMIRASRGFAGFAAGMILSYGVMAANGPSTSCATPDANAPITTCFFDLTASPSSPQPPASALLNGGIFRVPAQTDDPLGKGFIVGTGVFNPFVRIQERGNGADLKSNGIETGYNTDGRDGQGNPAMLELDNHDKG